VTCRPDATSMTSTKGSPTTRVSRRSRSRSEGRGRQRRDWQWRRPTTYEVERAHTSLLERSRPLDITLEGAHGSRVPGCPPLSSSLGVATHAVSTSPDTAAGWTRRIRSLVNKAASCFTTSSRLPEGRLLHSAFP
jgi:hypothetical protein